MRDHDIETGVSRRAVLAGLAAVGASTLLPRPALAAPVAKLGSRELHVISDGGFTLPLNMMARGVKPEELTAFLKAEGLPTDHSTSVLNVTLLKEGDELTFFDCGSGSNFLPGSGKLAANLEAAGIDREKVTRVLLTHAHPDHVWGAIDEFDSELFPNAKYVISEAEWAFWTSPDVFGKLPEDRQSFAAGAQRILKAIADKVTRVKPGQEVAPGILALDTAGHTPGHMSFQVSGGGQSVLVLGDAITHRAISFKHPDWKSGSDFDPDLGIATRKKLLDKLTAEKMPFIGYHLPSPGLGRSEKDGAAYRFVAG